MATQVVNQVPTVSALEQAKTKLENEAKAKNDSRGKEKGTRIRVGATRGKNPKAISYEAFDESLPDTLPESISEFTALVGVAGVKVANEKALVLDYLVPGFNLAQYQAESDPIAEYVDPTWSQDMQTRFRNVIRNFVGGTGMEIADAVAMIKPQFDAAAKSATA